MPTDSVPSGGEAVPSPAAPYSEIITGSRLDQGLTWYRGEFALRRLVGLLALPALAGLTGFGMLIDRGAMPWVMASLTFLAGAEAYSASRALRRERRSEPDVNIR